VQRLLLSVLSFDLRAVVGPAGLEPATNGL
jgi:hypothetical protein